MKVYRPAASGRLEGDSLSGYRRVAAALGGTDFMNSIDSALRTLGGAQRWYFFRQTWSARGEPPRMVSCHHEHGLTKLVDAYAGSFFKSDPLNDVLGSVRGRDGRLVVSVAPDDISDSDYRTHCLEERNIVQRLSMAEEQDGSWAILNIGRDADSGQLDDGRIRELWAFSQLVFPLVERHCELTRVSREPDIDIAEVERQVHCRCPKLTRRETQVCARTVIGHTAKSIARDLGIGVESVATYRKRAYQRLGVSGAEQVSKRVLGSAVQPGSSKRAVTVPMLS